MNLIASFLQVGLAIISGSRQVEFPVFVNEADKMKALFEFGRIDGSDGTAWHDAPPELKMPGG